MVGYSTEMGHRYPQPDNEDDFEKLCLRFYRKLWKNGSLNLYAKRGEKQDGIDIFDPLSINPVSAIQCKHHEPHKNITPAEIKAEVRKAEKSTIALNRYVIATTAKKSKNAQNTVIELNLRTKKPFTVELHFWEDICELVGQYGRVVAELIIYGENILAGANLVEAETYSHSVNAMILECDSGASGGILGEIEKLLDERRFDAARHALEKQPIGDAAKILPIQHQYMLLRSRGRLAMEARDWAVASSMFLSAYELNPTLEQAKENQVLGIMLSGNMHAAYRAAASHMSAGACTRVMACRLVDCVSTLEQLRMHQASFEQWLETDTEINTSICHKYIEFRLLDEAIYAANRALKVSPASPHSHLAAAMAYHTAAVEEKLQQRLFRLNTAIEHYLHAEKESTKQKYPLLMPEILVNRGAAYMLLGQKAKAAMDFRAVGRIGNVPESYIHRSIEYFIQESDYSSVRELLELLDGSTIEGQLFAIIVEHNGADAAGKVEALDKMIRLANSASYQESLCRSFCVQWALDLGELNRAEQCLTDEFFVEFPFQAETLLAWIRLAEKNEIEARAAAERALASTVRDVRKENVRLLALVLIRLKDYARALNLLEEVTYPGVLDNEMELLIGCAEKLGRHDLLLRLCQELRANGTRDAKLQRLEVDLLDIYAPEKALHLTKELSDESETPNLYVAYHNHLLMRLGRTEEMNFDIGALPTGNQLNLNDAYLVVEPYLKSNRYDDALRFVYEQRRHYFDDLQAHYCYVSFFLNFSNHLSTLTPPTSVIDNCAVLFRSAEGQSRWLTIEDSNPRPSRNEISPDSDIAKSLRGLRVSDTCVLPVGFVGEERVTITEIQSKYVRAVQHSYQNLKQWFPGKVPIQHVCVEKDGQFDFSEIEQSLKRRQEYVKSCLGVYLTHPCSLYLLADRLGCYEWEAVNFLSYHEQGVIKCCDTNAAQFALTSKSGVTVNSFVLDLSAIVTLTLCNAWKLLPTRNEYFVSQLTLEIVEEWFYDAQLKLTSDDGVAMLDDSGRLYIREATDREKSQRVETLEHMREMLHKYSQRRSSLVISKMDPKKRSLYEKSIGMHNLEAIGTASELGLIIWSDDIIVASIANDEFSVERVWTQLAFRRFVQGGTINSFDYESVSAKLTGHNYGNTIWNANTLLTAAEDARWDIRSWPFNRFINQISKSDQLIANAGIVLGFVKLLRNSSCAEMRQSAVLQSLLDALGSHHAVHWMLDHVNDLFYVDALSAKFMRDELQFWLKKGPLDI